MMFLNFSNYFAFIFEFSNSGRVRTDRKEIFFVLYFSSCLDPCHLEMKPGWCFLFFRFFLHLFLNFLTRVGFEQIGRKLFLFSIFRPVLARFVFKWSLDDVFEFLKCFCMYFWILELGSGSNGYEGNFFSSLFFGLSWPVSSWNETWTMFFNF